MRSDIAAVERSVLSVLLNDSHAIIPVQGVLDDVTVFSDPFHRQVYTAILDLTRQSTVPNVYTVSDRTGLALGDLQKLAGGFNTKLSREVLYSADLLVKDAGWRRLAEAAQESQGLVQERRGSPQDAALFCAQMFTASIDRHNDESPLIGEVSKRFDDEVAAIARGEAGVRLGPRLRFLQDKTSGLRPGHIWMITAPYKGRKCVTGDTLVLTRAGWWRIDELCGDVPFGFTEKRVELWTRRGWAPTSHVYRAPAGPTVKIRTASGRTLEGTPKHPILAAGPSGVTWRPLGDLPQGARVAICRPDARAGYDFDTVTDSEPGCAETWDVAVPGDHSFVSNGFISHNTSLMRNLVLHACRAGASVSVFALEGTEAGTYAGLTALLATERLLAKGHTEQAHLSETFILRGQRDSLQQQAIAEARAELDKWSLRIYDARKGITNPDKLIHFIKRDRFMFDLQVYAVDYLQLLGEGKLFDRIESATHQLQQITVEERLTALILAQLNEATIRESAETYSPGIKGGGDPAAASDFLIRTRYDGMNTPNVLTVQLKLARHARPGTQRYRINAPSGLILEEEGKEVEE